MLLLLKIFVITLSLLVINVSGKTLSDEITLEISENSKNNNNGDSSVKVMESINLKADSNVNESIPIVRYEGTQLWRIPITDDEERNTVSQLAKNYDGKMWMNDGEIVDILIKSDVLQDAEELLKKSNLSHVVLIDDLQKAIDEENPPKEEIEMFQNRKGHRMTWRAYHRVSDIHGYLDYLAKTYPDLCSVHTIGASHQSRPLKLLKISNHNSNNRKIWIDGGIHAREWISPASVTYIIDQIVENWEDMPQYMRKIDWYILPVANPDGYEYTHQYDRLWRKNRKQSGTCIGTDLNRNFGYHWGGQGSSRNPCADTFGGVQAFSEPETAAIKNFLSKFGVGHFKSYITFHSYGQYVLYPWGHDRTVPADYRDLDRIGKEGAAQMLRVGGGRYQVGNSGALLYPAAGGSDDWAKGVLGIKYAYTVELRDNGRHGFVLPASMIEITSKEALAFVSTVARAVNAHQ